MVLGHLWVLFELRGGVDPCVTHRDALDGKVVLVRLSAVLNHKVLRDGWNIMPRVRFSSYVKLLIRTNMMHATPSVTFHSVAGVFLTEERLHKLPNMTSRRVRRSTKVGAVNDAEACSDGLIDEN